MVWPFKAIPSMPGPLLATLWVFVWWFLLVSVCIVDGHMQTNSIILLTFCFLRILKVLFFSKGVFQSSWGGQAFANIKILPGYNLRKSLPSQDARRKPR